MGLIRTDPRASPGCIHPAKGQPWRVVPIQFTRFFHSPLEGVVEKFSLVGIDHRRHSGESRNPFELFTEQGARPCCCAASRCRIQRIRLSFLCSILILPAREQRRLNEEAKRQRRKWIPAFAGMTSTGKTIPLLRNAKVHSPLEGESVS